MGLGAGATRQFGILAISVGAADLFFIDGLGALLRIVGSSEGQKVVSVFPLGALDVCDIVGVSVGY